jgi:hypothetical protein
VNKWMLVCYCPMRMAGLDTQHTHTTEWKIPAKDTVNLRVFKSVAIVEEFQLL